MNAKLKEETQGRIYGKCEKQIWGTKRKSKWDSLTEDLVTSAIGIIPKENTRRKKWMDDRWNTRHDGKETKKRQRHGTDYRSLHKEIRKNCKHAKNKWINEEYTYDMNKKISEITWFIKSKNGNLILDKKKYFIDERNILENSFTNNCQYIEKPTN